MMARRAPARRSFLYRNGLSLSFGALMLVALAGHAWAGWRMAQEEARDQHRAAPTLASYLASGEFHSSVFENWESEFLQMGLFVLLTVHLRQQGSSESRKLDPAQEKKKTYPARVQPWAARQRGWVRKLYEHSLSLALLLLFALSFVGHWIGSWRHAVDEALAQGLPPPALLDYLGSARLWFESMQNWQSEFLAVLAIVLLSVFLREKDSSQSKDVEAPHSETGA
jgi:hypothetical protein